MEEVRARLLLDDTASIPGEYIPDSTRTREARVDALYDTLIRLAEGTG